jgi:hypothetical protein
MTQSRSYEVGYFVGSLSSTSINRVLSRALIRVAPPELTFTEIPMATCRSTVRTTTPTTRPRPRR